MNSLLRFFPTLDNSFGRKICTRMDVLCSGLTKGMRRLPGKRSFLCKTHMFPAITDPKLLFTPQQQHFLMCDRLILTQLNIQLTKKFNYAYHGMP